MLGNKSANLWKDNFPFGLEAYHISTTGSVIFATLDRKLLSGMIIVSNVAMSLK